MYFWKCWRDTRSFFIVFAIIAAIVMPVAAVVCVGTGLLETFGREAFLSTFALIVMFVALALGALCASEEFADSTIHFLFTKPRSRAYFLWTGWVAGCAQLLAIALINRAAGSLTLAHYSKNPAHVAVLDSAMYQQLAGAAIEGLYVYCLTYALTVVLRNGLRGLGASMAVVFGVPFFAIAVRWRWKISLPVPTVPIASVSPFTSNIIWLLVALLFVFVAQLVIERTEI
jgi:ABC-type transport system involved in multi-copper enzyme maturation permease subunit